MMFIGTSFNDLTWNVIVQNEIDNKTEQDNWSNECLKDTRHL